MNNIIQSMKSSDTLKENKVKTNNLQDVSRSEDSDIMHFAVLFFDRRKWKLRKLFQLQ